MSKRSRKMLLIAAAALVGLALLAHGLGGELADTLRRMHGTR